MAAAAGADFRPIGGGVPLPHEDFTSPISTQISRIETLMNSRLRSGFAKATEIVTFQHSLDCEYTRAEVLLSKAGDRLDRKSPGYAAQQKTLRVAEQFYDYLASIEETLKPSDSFYIDSHFRALLVQFSIRPRFRVGDVLGRGSFGEVRRTGVGPLVVADKTAVGKKAEKELIQEHRMLHSIPEHPNIIHGGLLGRVKDVLHLFTELADGDIKSMSKDSEITADQVVDAFQGIAQGLEHMHKHGIVHCDLKPANVFHIGRTTRIGDLGGAQKVGDTVPTGTPFFAPPELPSGPAAHPSFDSWSYGAMLFKILTGETVVKPQPYDTPITYIVRVGRTSQEDIDARIEEIRSLPRVRTLDPTGDGIALLRATLRIKPAERATMTTILTSDLFPQEVKDEPGLPAIRAKAEIAEEVPEELEVGGAARSPAKIGSPDTVEGSDVEESEGSIGVPSKVSVAADDEEYTLDFE